MFLIVPSSKNKQVAETEGPTGPIIEDPEAAPVLLKVQATIPDMNAISLTVPPEATDSQVAGLLKRFKSDRLSGTLTDLLPATTAGHKLGSHAVADIYIVLIPIRATRRDPHPDPRRARTGQSVSPGRSL